MSKRRRLQGHLSGLVQGVGMRPYLARLAHRLELAGNARNVGEGVLVEIEGEPAAVAEFVAELPVSQPRAARIDAASWRELEPGGATLFTLEESEAGGGRRLSLPPDLRTCEACTAEVADPAGRRHGYPFTSCSDCGPRYTIVQSLPYDRASTTMAGFEMCDACRREFEDPEDRRYHAQPLACPACGPTLELLDSSGESQASGSEALDRTAALLVDGSIVAVKGLGGFQLLADATNSGALSRLRVRKGRPEKPFAVLFVDLDTAREAAHVSDSESELLTSAFAPIVLLTGKGRVLAPEVAPGSARVGGMLPTTPLHELLVRRAGTPLVCTSGNRHEEPIATGNREAIERLAGIADAFLVHDRPVHRRADDGVAQVVAGRSRVLRAGRGLAPLELSLDLGDQAPVILAVGAHLKVAPAVLVNGRAVLGLHIGDLEGLVARQAFDESVAGLLELLSVRPVRVACDAHPDYASTLLAEQMQARDPDLEIVRVQHHHAHAAACMAEHGLDRALAFTWDGAGLGDDQTVWGGEVLEVSPAGARRVAHLHPFPIVGGDRAARDCLRPLAGVLVAAELDKGSPPTVEARLLDLTRRTKSCTTSAGRLFDAVAAILGLPPRQSFEGQAAMRLEELATHGPQVLEVEPYPFLVTAGVMDWRSMLRPLLSERNDPTVAAARFHATLVHMIVAVARHHPAPGVVLAGGCFQNRILAEGALALLAQANIPAYLPERVPVGDGGLALGQLWIAARIGSSGSEAAIPAQ